MQSNADADVRGKQTGPGDGVTDVISFAAPRFSRGHNILRLVETV